MAPTLADIEHLDAKLKARFGQKLLVHPALTRSLVSFQASKGRPIHRWYKYKEAFSASLVEYLFARYKVTTGKVLDPFAGIGTTLFTASSLGIDAEGIELLPIGQQVIKARQVVEAGLTDEDLETLRYWARERPWVNSPSTVSLQELRITRGAYPTSTKEAIENTLGACTKEDARVQVVLRFALLCVLESVSYTRKDGQYLRWDYRSGRTQGKKPFSKGEILDFDAAMAGKIEEIVHDLTAPKDLFDAMGRQGRIGIHQGSCLDILPEIGDSQFDGIMTSPPYCNRYDYTRTYALELALLGTDERELVKLRQEMLSCTVENRAKDLLKINPHWQDALAVADRQALLQAILGYLEDQRAKGSLNNTGIPRMVRGYFNEMACVIAECARVSKPGAPFFMVNDNVRYAGASTFFMVNDNVRYAGASISVDLILSSFAEQLGFEVEAILVLPNGKGNSSQQMGEHGREALRKCVYVWRKA